jgi:hypothetical protein
MSKKYTKSRKYKKTNRNARGNFLPKTVKGIPHIKPKRTQRVFSYEEGTMFEPGIKRKIYEIDLDYSPGSKNSSQNSSDSWGQHIRIKDSSPLVSDLVKGLDFERAALEAEAAREKSNAKGTKKHKHRKHKKSAKKH